MGSLLLGVNLNFISRTEKINLIVEEETEVSVENDDDNNETNDSPNDMICNNNDNVENVIIKFDNYIDLQTRLVLLPLHEDECIGAIVSSYTSKSSSSDNNNNTSTTTTNDDDNDNN